MTTRQLTSTSTARALWYVDRCLVELRNEQLPDFDPDNSVLIRTHYSGLSRGTERLVFRGEVPASEADRMRAPMQLGAFPFPVKYGYCAVGIIEQGPAKLVGHAAFCLHPHQDVFVVPQDAISLIPPHIPVRRATLAANMETALNALWDGNAKPGDRINVIGAGIVGLLTAFVAAGIPGTSVTIADVSTARADIANALGAAFCTPADLPANVDVVFHTTATPEGLQSAIETAGFEATIVEMSWFGTRTAPIVLGGAFHSRRLNLVSSQVGHVASARRARWSHARRLAKAIELLSDPRLDALVGDEIAFETAPRALPDVFSADYAGLPPVVRYV
ncbi:MAG: zinc-binding alcohol dehydrogenase [Hyphomicrobiaceae bacterium]